MDFLDPKARRHHKIRLFIGYGLMAAVILTTSAILVFSAYGFDVDRKTGEVIQNGLVFIDSAPDGAIVRFNGQEQKDRTNNRFALPSGDYNVAIEKNGYRQWQRSFTLNGGEVERFNYPLLVPSTLERREIQAFPLSPTIVTQSPDRRWVLVGQAGSLVNYAEYDLNSLDGPSKDPQVRQFGLPADLFTAAEGGHLIEPVEWSTDNRHVLIKHSFANSYEFVVISRDQPATSININRLLGQNPTKVTLRDKKFDQWYIYEQQGGVLQIATANKVVTPVASEVTAYKTHDDSTLLYATLVNNGANQRITLKQGNAAYTVREVAPGPLMLEIARYDNRWYAVIGSDTEQKTYIYEDPVATLQKRDGSLVTPVAILKSTGPLTSVSFSHNTRFIAAQSGQHFEIYDAEYDQTFRYDIAAVFDAGNPVVWMDGHRLSGRSGGKAVVFDFDSSNQQELVAAQAGSPLLFNQDYEVLYNIDASAQADKSGLFVTQLRLPGDR